MCLKGQFSISTYVPDLGFYSGRQAPFSLKFTDFFLISKQCSYGKMRSVIIKASWWYKRQADLMKKFFKSIHNLPEILVCFDYRNSNGCSDLGEQEAESPSSLKTRPFFRRFSFRGITKGKALNIFHKQGSDEVELSSSSSNSR